MIRAAAVGALAAALGTCACACEPGLAGAQRIEGQQHVVAWRAQPSPRLGEFFALEVAVCARDGSAPPATLRVDATMPAHRHGMNYVPRVLRGGDGRFTVTGLLLHMPGTWELRFDLRAAERGETLRAALELR